MIVVLTGSGISAESGLATFRGSDGLWEGHRIEDVASPEGFVANPRLVHEFYNKRRNQLLSGKVRPNCAHDALAMLENGISVPYLLVTQNIDNLHERAGSQNIIHIHGELLKARCLLSGKVTECFGDLSVEKTPNLRPHVVWFGEMPLGLEAIYSILPKCSLFAAIGTSGQVYPAADFVNHCSNARKVEINLEPTAISNYFDDHYYGPATKAVPQFVNDLLHIE